LSKKEKRIQNSEKRIRWDFSPVSRIIPNKKKKMEKKIHFDPDE